MNKKGIVTHPATLAIIAFLVGVILMVLLCKGVISIGGISKSLCS